MIEAPATAAPALEPEKFPPRYWWFKRLALLTLALVVVNLVLHLVWMRLAEARLTDLVNSAHSRGEPLLAADLSPPPAPDEDNAALLLIQAAGLLRLTPSQSAVLDVLPDKPRDLTPLHAVIDANQPALRLVRDARSKRKINWGIGATTPLMRLSFTHLSPQRQLARICAAAALHAYYGGDHAAAVEYCRDTLFIAAAVDHPPASITSHINARGVEKLALEALQEMQHDLKLTDVEQHERAVSREQALELIRELADDNPRQQALRHALLGERAYGLDTVLWTANKLTLLRPLAVMSGVSLAQQSDAGLQPAALATFPAAQQAMPRPEPARRFGPQAMTRLAHVSLPPSTVPWLRSSFAAAAERRKLATELAIRLHEIDHEGQAPRTLADLVPDYLPDVPNDPFAAKSDTPLLYMNEPGGRGVHSIADVDSI